MVTSKILVVDDEEHVCQSVKKILTRKGYTVENALDVETAVKKMNSSPYDLVITDLTMPQVTGVEFAEKLMDVRPDIPVILCTGMNDGIDEKRVKAAGIREILMMPANLSELKDAVHRALER